MRNKQFTKCVRRVDGAVVDTRNAVRRSLSNDTVLLDILPGNMTSGGNSGTMISMQFHSGTSFCHLPM